METKSRYEVIAELEARKRALISERDSLKETLAKKEKLVTLTERKKADTILYIDRELEDLREDVAKFIDSMDERKETIRELIASVDASLERFSTLAKTTK